MKLPYLIVVTALLSASFAASAASGYRYPMPGDSSRDGEAQCGRMANMTVNIYYENWVLSGNGAKFPLAKAKDYYGEHSGRDTDEAHNALVEAHLTRIWAGKYKSQEESTDDFYGRCMESDLRKFLDKKWVK